MQQECIDNSDDESDETTAFIICLNIPYCITSSSLARVHIISILPGLQYLSPSFPVCHASVPYFRERRDLQNPMPNKKARDVWRGV